MKQKQLLTGFFFLLMGFGMNAQTVFSEIQKETRRILDADSPTR